MTLPPPSSEEMSAVPRPDHDGLWQAGTADLVKWWLFCSEGSTTAGLALGSRVGLARAAALLSVRHSDDCVRWNSSTHVCVMPPSGLNLFTHSPTREQVGLAAGDTKLYCLTSLSLRPIGHSRSGAGPVERTTSRLTS